jgi:hypothetical protein
MNLPRLLPAALALALGGAALLSGGIARAQDTSSVNQAFQIARTAVKPELQNKVVSVYGLGTPDAIQKWYIIFYDPSVPSHGQAVLVQGGKIIKSYPANGGSTYSARLTFDPSRITSEQPALNAAQNYASRHNIAYNNVRALLKQTGVNKPFRWRIELRDSNGSCGFVLINAIDDSVAGYAPHETATHRASSGTSSGSASGNTDNFGDDVKSTFLGIGGDLQQFFTGERTVDR